jgi:hypothetical protein
VCKKGSNSGRSKFGGGGKEEDAEDPKRGPLLVLFAECMCVLAECWRTQWIIAKLRRDVVSIQRYKRN